MRSDAKQPQTTSYILPAWRIGIDDGPLADQLRDELKGVGQTPPAYATFTSLCERLEDACAPFSRIEEHREDGHLMGLSCEVDKEALADAVYDGEVKHVSDLSELDDNYEGYVLLTNDHGNQSLYSSKNQVLTSIWAVV